MATSWTNMHQPSHQPHLPPTRCMMATTTTSFHGCWRSHVWWLIANGRTICTASRASTYCCPLPTNWWVKSNKLTFIPVLLLPPALIHLITCTSLLVPPYLRFYFPPSLPCCFPTTFFLALLCHVSLCYILQCTLGGETETGTFDASSREV